VRKSFYWVIILLFIFFVKGYADVIDGIAAIVNNEIIYISDLNYALKPYKMKLQHLPIAKEKKIKQLKMIKKQLLDNLINEKLIEQKAKELNYTVSEKDVDILIQNILTEQHITLSELKESLKQSNVSYEYYREKLKGELIRAKVVNFYVKSSIQIQSKEIEKYVKEHLLPKNKDIKYHIKQIFFKNYNKEKVDFILKLLNKEPFSKVARQYSEGPFRDVGGELGFFKKGQMLPAIEHIVEKMNPGEIKFVKSQHGYHIIKLVEIKSKKIDKTVLYKRAEEILKRKMLDKKLNEWLQNLRQKAVIIKKI